MSVKEKLSEKQFRELAKIAGYGGLECFNIHSGTDLPYPVMSLSNQEDFPFLCDIETAVAFVFNYEMFWEWDKCTKRSVQHQNILFEKLFDWNIYSPGKM